MDASEALLGGAQAPRPRSVSWAEPTHMASPAFCGNRSDSGDPIFGISGTLLIFFEKIKSVPRIS
jgi:hypothetical protein